MNAIATIIETNPVAVLTDTKVYSEFYDQMKAEIDAFEPDLTTVTGRKAIASLAYKVTRTKTAIDDAGKRLNEEARAKINAVDAQRRKVREELDALADEARRPLTDWEAAEAQRVAECNNTINRIGLSIIVTQDDTAETVSRRLDDLRREVISAETFQEGYDVAKERLSSAIDSLERAVARLTQEEADRAELARLRRDKEEREAQEFARAEEARLAAEAAAEEERRAEAERLASERREAEAAEADRRAKEREAQAIAAAAEQAERKAREEAQAKIDAANAEAERLRKQAEAKAAEEAAAAAEQARRDADRAHRGKTMGAAKDAIVALGTDAETARKIVLAIVAGEIPNVTLRF